AGSSSRSSARQPPPGTPSSAHRSAPRRRPSSGSTKSVPSGRSQTNAPEPASTASSASTAASSAISPRTRTISYGGGATRVSSASARAGSTPSSAADSSLP